MHPSIFNDVIGPVMRGPSSSHCAADERLPDSARALRETGVRIRIETVDVGGRLPREMRCTALGGLSVTRTSRAIDARFAGSVRRPPAL